MTMGRPSRLGSRLTSTAPLGPKVYSPQEVGTWPFLSSLTSGWMAAQAPELPVAKERVVLA